MRSKMASTDSERRRIWRERRGSWEESGQATVEYLLVGIVLIALICAVAALWRFVADGGMDELVRLQASHAIENPGGVLDAILF
jgi:hypothetical protein